MHFGFIWCLLLQNFIWDITTHLLVRSFGAPVSCGGFSDFLVLMTLTVLRRPGQVCCRMPHWNLCVVLLKIRLRLWVLRKKRPSSSYIKGTYYQYDLWLSVLALIIQLKAVYSKLLCSKVSLPLLPVPLPGYFHIIHFGMESLYAGHTLGMGVMLPTLKAVEIST